MIYYYDHEIKRENKRKWKLLKVERNKFNPLSGLTFVSIAYYEKENKEIVGIVFWNGGIKQWR